MRKILLLISFVIVTPYISWSQWSWRIDFENPSVFNKIFIDTTANPNNIWQIGQPSKSIFDSAFSPTHAILTDTVNPYPINDTSSFIVTHERVSGPPYNNWELLLDFYFKMDSDTLTDFGKAELSFDNGINWIDIMALDPLSTGIIWEEPKPELTGSIHTWTHFSVDLAGLSYIYPYSDTILFKFSFISDSIQTFKEGWMIDDFRFVDVWEGIEEHRDDNAISIYPIPSSDYLSIERKNCGNNETVEVMDLSGRIILINKHFKGETLDIKSLKAGTYFLKYNDNEKVAIKPFVVIH